MSQSIERVATDQDHVYAFRINGELDKDSMQAMALTMDKAFDIHDRVNMLLIFDRYEGAATGASVQPDVIQAQLRSISTVDKYAVVGAPKFAEAMISASSKLLPVKAKAFETDEVAQAWAFVGAQPA